MKTTLQTKKELVKNLKGHVKKLQTELKAVKKVESADAALRVKIQKSQSRFERIKNPRGADQGIGKYLLDVAISTLTQEVYIPVSIASGKKVTGFMYQIEGTSVGSLAHASVSAKGEGVTQVTVGTILYCKIPRGKTAVFRIQIEIRGKIGKSYVIAFTRINYKLTPKDARYVQYTKELRTTPLQFK